MLDGHLFDTLAEIADCLRKKTTKPFGGIQVLFYCFIYESLVGYQMSVEIVN